MPGGTVPQGSINRAHSGLKDHGSTSISLSQPPVLQAGILLYEGLISLSLCRGLSRLKPYSS